MSNFNPQKKHKNNAYFRHLTIEGIVTVAVGSVIAMGLTGLVDTHTRSSAAMEALKNIKQNRAQVIEFVDTEVAMSNQVISDPYNVDLNQCKSEISTDDFIFALTLKSGDEPVIYYSSLLDNSESTELTKLDFLGAVLK